MQYKKLLYTIIILLTTHVILGQSTISTDTNNSPRSFTIDEAVTFATEHAYEILNSNYDLYKAKKKIWETTASGLPQVNAEINYNDNLDIMTQMLPAEIFNGTKGTFVPVKFGQQYTADASITATQLLFDGVYLTGLKASKVYYKLVQNQQEKVLESIKEATMNAYFYVLATEENYQTLQHNLKVNKKLAKETQAYFEEGLLEDTDTHQTDLAVSNSESLTNEALRSITAARTTLKYLLGIDVNSKITLKSSLKDLIEDILLQQKNNALDWEGHIDYRILQTQHKAQELMLQKEKASYLPSLSAFYRLGKNTAYGEWNVLNKDNKWFKSSIVGLKLSIPIFSSGMRYSKVQQERIGLKQVENRMTQKIQELEQNKILTENNLKTSRTNYLLAVKSKNLAQKIFEKTQLKYKEGISNSMELTQKEQQYLQTHSKYIQSMIALLQANIAYKKAMGII